MASAFYAVPADQIAPRKDRKETVGRQRSPQGKKINIHKSHQGNELYHGQTPTLLASRNIKNSRQLEKYLTRVRNHLDRCRKRQLSILWLEYQSQTTLKQLLENHWIRTYFRSDSTFPRQKNKREYPRQV